MTLAELKAMHGAMTSHGPYRTHDTKTGGRHIETCPPDKDNLRTFVACWLRDADAEGFVALHNHFPALVAVIEAQRKALERIQNAPYLQQSRIEEIVAAALALADKPLEEVAAS